MIDIVRRKKDRSTRTYVRRVDTFFKRSDFYSFSPFFFSPSLFFSFFSLVSRHTAVSLLSNTLSTRQLSRKTELYLYYVYLLYRLDILACIWTLYYYSIWTLYIGTIYRKPQTPYVQSILYYPQIHIGYPVYLVLYHIV